MSAGRTMEIPGPEEAAPYFFRYINRVRNTDILAEPSGLLAVASRGG